MAYSLTDAEIYLLGDSLEAPNMSLGPRITFFRNCVPPSSLHCKDLCNQWVSIIEHELRSSINVPASALLRTWVSRNYPEFQEQVPQVPWDTQPV